jgi:hypothetical protein
MSRSRVYKDLNLINESYIDQEFSKFPQSYYMINLYSNLVKFNYNNHYIDIYFE